MASSTEVVDANRAESMDEITKLFDHFGCSATATLKDNLKTLSERVKANTNTMTMAELMDALAVRTSLVAQIKDKAVKEATIRFFVAAMLAVLGRQEVLTDVRASSAIVSALSGMNENNELGRNSLDWRIFLDLLTTGGKLLEARVGGTAGDVLAALEFIELGVSVVRYDIVPMTCARSLIRALQAWGHDEEIARKTILRMRQIYGDGDFGGPMDEHTPEKVDTQTHRDAVEAVSHLFLARLAASSDLVVWANREVPREQQSAVDTAFGFLVERADEYAYLRACDCARDHAVTDTLLVAFNRFPHVRERLIYFLLRWAWCDVDSNWKGPDCRAVYLTKNGFLPALIDHAHELGPAIAAYVPHPDAANLGFYARFMGCNERLRLIKLIELIHASLRDATCAVARDLNLAGAAFACVLSDADMPNYAITRYSSMAMDTAVAEDAVRDLLDSLYDDRPRVSDATVAIGAAKGVPGEFEYFVGIESAEDD